MTTTTSNAGATKATPRSAIGKPDIVRESLVMVRRNLIHTKRHARDALGRDGAADHVRAAVRVRLRRVHQPPAAASTTESGCSPGSWDRPSRSLPSSSRSVMTNDLEKGIIDRFRSLPIGALVGARSDAAVAALIHSSIGIVVMALTGLLIGWRIREGFAKAVLAFALVLLFGFAMIWFGILIGSVMRSPEAVNGVMFTLLFPITFLSNAFVPTEPMPSWLRAIAEWNPISSLVQSMRELWGNGPAAPPEAPWPLQNPELSTVLWSIALTLIFAPFALRAYHKRTTD